MAKGKDRQITRTRMPGLSAVARATIRRNSAPEAQSISTENGLEAARRIAEVAEAEGVDFALAGGIAMHLYGFTRATTGVDIIASDVLNLKSTRDLSFGGESYPVEVGGRTINSISGASPSYCSTIWKLFTSKPTLCGRRMSVTKAQRS